MSIIHEALKKVQSNQPDNKNIFIKPPTPKSSVPCASPKNILTAQKPMRRPLFLLTGGLVLAALSGFSAYNLYLLSLSKSLVPTTNSNLVASGLPGAQRPNATITPKAPPKNELILSGIVQMDGKDFALINKEFYETGELVGEAKITKITAESIEILQNGKTQTIKVLRPQAIH